MVIGFLISPQFTIHFSINDKAYVSSSKFDSSLYFLVKNELGKQLAAKHK
ncbi:hypothetical protein BaDB11_00073 [Bacillus licheniformis]|jgi:hypothetical protein|nr:hypothetical protein BaDB11_00073 [Bacillus licheniformis]